MIGAPEPADAELVSLWVERRDESAFRALLARHSPLMRRAAAVALGTAARRDSGLVDDALQEAGLRLMDALGSFRGDCSTASFLAAVARRAALDELRKALRHRARGERLALLGPCASAGDGAGSPGGLALELERAEAAREVMELLSALPEPDRSLLYLRDAEALDLASLARAFGLPEGTVKSKLARARNRIRAKAMAAWGET